MKYFFLELVCCFAVLVSAAFGLKCYDCSYQDSHTSESQRNQDCKMADSKFKTNCDDSKQYCLKISGYENGKPVGFRECTDGTWATLVKGEDTCVPSTEVVNFHFKIQNKPVDLSNGTVCVCNSESCNGKERMISSKWTFVALALLGFLFPRLF